ncbi:MAG: TIGR01459 family HAD-type hydrolase [Hyphomicrobiaceae bacterium]|nr:MAG: TIGR01459 family HAD-type hydrolase [Hyphomicrobiaceae bacterium]
MTPEILTSAGSLLTRYDALFCDVWGVMHNGREAYAEAGAALARFRAGGGTVILVSNAPVPAEGVEYVLKKTGVRRDSWDAIVSSGDIALDHIAEKRYRRLHRVGPPGRDRSLFSRLPGPHAPLDEAEAIVCTGPKNGVTETVETYRELIETGVANALPFICANPDLVVDVGDKRHMCAGSLAAEYERLGGAVFWAGKPHPSAYNTALERAGALRGGVPALKRILAIGDAVRTDLAAAQGLGIDGVFITSGIHSEATMADGEIDAEKLAALFALADTPPAVAAMAVLRW